MEKLKTAVKCMKYLFGQKSCVFAFSSNEGASLFVFLAEIQVGA